MRGSLKQFECHEYQLSKAVYTGHWFTYHKEGTCHYPLVTAHTMLGVGMKRSYYVGRLLCHGVLVLKTVASCQ